MKFFTKSDRIFIKLQFLLPLAVIITFMVTGFVFTGCTNLYSDGACISSSSSGDGISISVTSENNILSFGTASSTSSARLISPDGCTFSSELDFYIWGTNLLDSNKKIDLQQITITAVDSANPIIGTFNFDFDRQFYRLNLAAVPKGKTYSTSTIVLSSSISIDLRECSEINFYLSSKTVSGKGDCSLAIYADNWTISTDYQATAGIYSLSDNSAIYETVLGVFPTCTTAPENPTYQFTKSEISSGTYNFKITFSKNFEAKRVSFTYSDFINILPNQTTKAVIGIPNIISSAPAAPSYLIAGYHDTDKISNDYYDVEFCWDDNSYNEEDFQLQLLDITSLSASTYKAYVPTLLDSFSGGTLTSTTSDMDTAWDKLVSALNSSYVKTYSRSYFENTNVTTDGSFTSNSLYAVLKLLYGKLYLARIRAVNSTGASDYAYLDLYNTGSKAFAQTSDSSFSPEAWKKDSSGINRYKIEYYFTKGIFYDDSTSANVSAYVSSSVYTNQKRTGSQEILNPVNYDYERGTTSGDSAEGANAGTTATTGDTTTSTATLKYLYNSIYYPWQNWKSDSAGGSNFSGTSYDGCENLFLFAFYGDDVVITDSEFVVKSTGTSYENSDIVVSAHPSSAISIIPFQQDTDLSDSVTDNSLTISKSSYKYLNLLINNTGTSPSSSGSVPEKYSSVAFTIAEQGGKIKTLTSLSTQYYGITYKYAQIDITEQNSNGKELFESGKTYNLFINAVLNGSSMNYMLSVIFED